MEEEHAMDCDEQTREENDENIAHEDVNDGLQVPSADEVLEMASGYLTPSSKSKKTPKSVKRSNFLPPDLMKQALCAYGVSLGEKDQSLLQLIAKFESDLISRGELEQMRLLRPYLWGKRAAKYLLDIDLPKKPNETDESKKPKIGIINELNVRAVLQLLDSDRLAYTVSHFPTDLTLDPFRTYSKQNEDLDCGVKTNWYRVYDIRFLLPVLYYVTSPGILLNCEKFIDSGALSMCVISLTSRCEGVRQLSLTILARFVEHLDSARRFTETPLSIALVEFIRNSLVDPSRKKPQQEVPEHNDDVSETETEAGVPFLQPLSAAFIVRLIATLNSPVSHKIYSRLSKYFQANSSTSPDIVVGFIGLLSVEDSKTFQYFQSWFLSWMADGIRSMGDIRLCDRAELFPRLMSLAKSPMAGSGKQVITRQILLIFCHATKIPLFAKQFCLDYSGVGWLRSVSSNLLTINKSYRTNQSSAILIDFDQVNLLSQISYNLSQSLSQLKSDRSINMAQRQIFNFSWSLLPVTARMQGSPYAGLALLEAIVTIKNQLGKLNDLELAIAEQNLYHVKLLSDMVQTQEPHHPVHDRLDRLVKEFSMFV